MKDRGEHRERREVPVEMEAEIGVMQPQAKGSPEPPDAGRGVDFPLEPLKGSGPAHTMILYFRPSEV